MSTEQRDVRPFAGPSSLEALLRHAELRFGTHSIESGARLVVEEHEFVHSPARLVLAKEASDLAAAVAAASASFAALDVTADQLGFAVILQSSFLKLMDVAVDQSLAEFVAGPATIDLSGPPRPAPLRVPRSGCTVEVIVYFAGDRLRRPRQPWRYGTWLARATFDVVTELAFTGFTPQPLTAAIKAEKGLSPKTARYVTLGAVSPFEEGVTEDVVEVWCDADLLAKMSANSKSPTSATLQRQLFVDAIAAIVAASAAEPEKLALATWSVVQDTLLGRVIAVVAPSGTTEAARVGACTTYLEMIKHDRAKFMTYVEEVAGLLGSYDGILGG